MSKATESPKQEAPAQEDMRAEQLVNAWVQEKLCNSDFSGNSDAWNHFATARSDLVSRISQALKGA